jgi:murein DD-endopeptidase MepM/ murein hydrolase activator NlpD
MRIFYRVCGVGPTRSGARPLWKRCGTSVDSTHKYSRPRARSLGIGALLTLLSCSGPTVPDVPNVVDCSSFPKAETALYVLPYRVGHRSQVTRTFDHYTPLNGGVGLYAVDFGMPIGTPVHAARAGVVVAVEERFSDDDRADFHENWVMIRHQDETIGRYIHLTQGGAMVEVGEPVSQGQMVGLSGNSGASSGPHLHFDLQSCGPNLPPGYNRLPCGRTLPLSFRNTGAHGCGLVSGRLYVARSFSADSR